MIFFPNQKFTLRNLCRVALAFALVAPVILAAAFVTAPGAAAQDKDPKTGRVTGYAIPRYVSLKSGQVNMRHGPGESYAIDWIYQRKGMPVEVVGEHDVWRKIRDHEGVTGWVHGQLLSGRRTALVTGGPVSLYRRQETATTGVAAIADPGVILNIHSCDARWCRAEVSGYKGWVTRDNLWGLYAYEDFE